MSAIAARLSASVITSHRQSWALLAVGACIANWMHSRITSRPTGRVRSRRLRTDRVVVSNSSTDARSTRLLASLSNVDRAGLVDAEDTQRAPQAKEHRDTQGQVKNLRVGEIFA